MTIVPAYKPFSGWIYFDWIRKTANQKNHCNRFITVTARVPFWRVLLLMYGDQDPVIQNCRILLQCNILKPSIFIWVFSISNLIYSDIKYCLMFINVTKRYSFNITNIIINMANNLHDGWSLFYLRLLAVTLKLNLYWQTP